MSELNPLQVKMTEVANKILLEKFGFEAKLENPEILRDNYRNRVLRFLLSDGIKSPFQSVIVKAADKQDDVEFDPNVDEAGGVAWRFYNEWSGNEFLSELRLPIAVSAQLIGGDREGGVFILEDLGSGSCLADLLQGSDAQAAETGLLNYAKALARMHAQTKGMRSEWSRIRARNSGSPTQTTHVGTDFLNENRQNFLEGLATIGVAPEVGLEAEFDQIATVFDHPGEWEAFSPEDTCPDNHRIMPDGSLRFFDFEFAGFRHALLDAAYLRVPFPTCWCVSRLPAGLSDRLEAEYLAEFRLRSESAIDPDEFAKGVGFAVAYWTIRTINWSLKDTLAADGQWGISSVRQRVIYRLETLLETISRHDSLPALAQTARAMKAKLLELWPDLIPMPLYPAFKENPSPANQV